VVCSADGKRIVSGSQDDSVKVWDAHTGQQLLTLRGHTGSVESVVFSTDGKRIVSGSQDDSVKVWDAQTGQEILELIGHTGGVNSVSFSPDGTRIVSESESGTVRVWDAASGQCLEVIEGTRDVASVAAGPTSFPWRARKSRLETVIEEFATGRPLAWLPFPPDSITTHPSGCTWAGAVGEYL